MIVLLLALSGVFAADDKAPAAVPAAAARQSESALVQKLLQYPDDLSLLREYCRESNSEISRLTADEPELATARLASYESVLNSLSPQVEETQRYLRLHKSSLLQMKRRIEILRTPLAD